MLNLIGSRKVDMVKGSACIALAFLSAGTFACSPVHTLDVSFGRDSAKLPGDELIKLANWAIDLQLKYPNLDRTSVGGLAEADERQPRVLAQQRAESIKGLLITLGLGRAPIDVDARLYKPHHLNGLPDNGRRVEVDFLPGCPHECPCQVK
ncbi:MULTISPECIES: hypothetical protein [unclassified Burkholderia]|uniref:hypothetical protein n=1 Tax=unclassified Burkholderia TaxID=2613784 RepID=UPI001E4E7E65|nr:MULTISPECIES: hypothetical protein [unclassified Burkholderia]UEP27301.1 hypothetical protein LMA01_13485 [Burkholderia sp. B21-007]UEP40820.1 hypothetical protein LMA02_13410 [Burkholderia sp. B21-005]